MRACLPQQPDYPAGSMQFIGINGPAEPRRRVSGSQSGQVVVVFRPSETRATWERRGPIPNR
jgi:hypothetical protein